jgi:hypothetical protein
MLDPGSLLRMPVSKPAHEPYWLSVTIAASYDAGRSTVLIEGAGPSISIFES